MVHPKNIREFLTRRMIFLLAIQRQIPDLARSPGELAQIMELFPVRFYLELVGLQTFHRCIIRFRSINRQKAAYGVRALYPRPS